MPTPLSLLEKVQYTLNCDGFSPTFDTTKPHMAFISLAGLNGAFAEERMSESYVWSMRVAINAPNVDPKKLLSLPITLAIDATIDNVVRKRFYNAVITGFTPCHEQLQLADTNKLNYWIYDLQIESSLFSLVRRIDSRIFPAGKTAIEIIKFLFKDHGLDQADFSKISSSIKKYSGPVAQFKESDYDFLRRIVQDAGLFFWFEHTPDGKQKIYFGNKVQASDVKPLVPNYLGSTPFSVQVAAPAGIPNIPQTPANPQVGFYNWRHDYHISPASLTFNSVDPTDPNKQLELSQKINSDNQAQAIKASVYIPDAVYNTTADGQSAMEIALQRQSFVNNIIRVDSTVPDVAVGNLFQTKKEQGFNKFPDADVGQFLITAIAFRIDLSLASAQGNLLNFATNWNLTTSSVTCIPFGKIIPCASYTDLPESLVANTMHWATIVTPAGKPQTDQNDTAAHPDNFNQVYIGLSWDQQERQKAGEFTPGILAIGNSGPTVTSAYHIGHSVLVAFSGWDRLPVIVAGPIYNQQLTPFAGDAASLGTKTVIMHQRQTAQEDAAKLNRIVLDDKVSQELVEMVAARALEIFAGAKDYQTKTGQAEGSLVIGNANSKMEFIPDEKDPAIRLQVGSKSAFTIYGNRMVFSVGSAQMTFKPEGETSNFSMVTASDLVVNAMNIELAAKAAFAAKAGLSAELQANATVTINGKMGVNLTGLAVNQK